MSLNRFTPLGEPILVTGGLGFIGGHLVDRFLADGIGNVRILDNYRRAVTPIEHWPADKVRLIQGDIRKIADVRAAIAGCQLVYHLAAQSNVIGAVNDPEYSCATNVLGTLNVLIAARDAGVPKVVFTSSREVYGEVDRLPVPESAFLHPKNLYGASKAAAEMYCRAFADDVLEVAVLRLANVYGPRDRDRVIPIFASQAMEGEPLTLYGGDQVLDFVWIETVVELLLRIGFGEEVPFVLNVGSGVGTTVKELARRILELVPSGSHCICLPPRSLEVTKFISDVTLAKRYLGLTDVNDPLEHLVQIIQKGEVAEVGY